MGDACDYDGLELVESAHNGEFMGKEAVVVDEVRGQKRRRGEEER